MHREVVALRRATESRPEMTTISGAMILRGGDAAHAVGWRHGDQDICANEFERHRAQRDGNKQGGELPRDRRRLREHLPLAAHAARAHGEQARARDGQQHEAGGGELVGAGRALRRSSRKHHGFGQAVKRPVRRQRASAAPRKNTSVVPTPESTHPRRNTVDRSSKGKISWARSR